jgi:hypothetical protein
MRGPTYTRIAAATGIDFAVLVLLIALIERVKDMPNAGEVAVHAGNGLFATIALLYGLAAITFFWFASTFAARILELEGGSGRLAAAMNGSGAVFAGVLALGVGAMWAAHQTISTDSAALASSLVNGPVLFFPAAVFAGASGVVGVRTAGLPTYSRVMARLSVLLAIALVGGAALMLYQNYAWINDTMLIVFALWTAVVSVIGIIRWGDMDEPFEATDEADAEEAPDVRDVTVPVDVMGASTAHRKPAPKSKPKPAPRKKPASRKAKSARSSDDDIDEFLSE